MHSGIVRSSRHRRWIRSRSCLSPFEMEDPDHCNYCSGRPDGRKQAAMSADQVTTLNAAFDDYPQTQALKRGDVRSDRIAFKFSDIKPANKFFKPMVRELKFDVSELAIGTFLQAKAYGKPLVLLPATIMGRFQHGTMLYNAARGTPHARGPAGQARRGAGLCPDHRRMDARHPHQRLRRGRRSIPLGHAGGWPCGRVPRAARRRAGRADKDSCRCCATGARRRDLWRQPAQRPDLKSVIPTPMRPPRNGMRSTRWCRSTTWSS